MSALRTTVYAGALVAAYGFVCAVIVRERAAWPHDALPTASQPLGWAYGWDCCSMTDCARLPDGEIKETAGGYLVATTGEVIPYGDKRIKRSKDEFYHGCAKGGDFKVKPWLCLYVPDRGF